MERRVLGYIAVKMNESFTNKDNQMQKLKKDYIGTNQRITTVHQVEIGKRGHSEIEAT